MIAILGEGWVSNDTIVIPDVCKGCTMRLS